MNFIGLPNYVCMVCDSDGIEVFGPERDQFRCKGCRIDIDPKKAKAIISEGFKASLVDVDSGIADEIINDARITEILEQMMSDSEETM